MVKVKPFTLMQPSYERERFAKLRYGDCVQCKRPLRDKHVWLCESCEREIRKRSAPTLEPDTQQGCRLEDL